MEQREHASQVVRNLFEIFMNTPNVMPEEWAGAAVAETSDMNKARVVADYISGMTDRFAQQEHDSLHRVR